MSSAINENPFVGLRPFEIDEGLLMFGRQEQTIQLLQRLHEYRFVGIVGSSGCGKSSLIRAGLIPALKAGYLVNERDKWMIPVFKPGEAPIHNFATAILSELHKDTSPAAVNSWVQKIKEEGAGVIIELLQPVFHGNRTNIFILVDQFEELFRFSTETKDAARKDEAIDFVNILLELFGNPAVPIYVVITMRSDFIGDCTQFFGLPEALNKSQYLVPRLTREQLKSAIEGPVRLYGGRINPALTTRLLNDSQKVKDELPLLQHSLMRIWDHEEKTDHNGELDLEDYIAIGGIEKALSNHADEALVGLKADEKHIAELMFQALTTTDQGGRKIRRPVHLEELVKLSGAPVKTIDKVINHFNEDKRCFLVVNKSIDANNPLIDISHESLIRQWDTLNNWVDKESESAKTYMRLSEAATLHKEGKRDLIEGTELQVALAWQTTQQPNATWAGRYSSNFEEALAFLEQSKAQAKKQRNARRIRRITYGIAAVLLLAALFMVVNSERGRIFATMEREQAIEQREMADSNSREAIRQKLLADNSSREAMRQKLLADSSSKEAYKQTLEALRQKEIAERSRAEAKHLAELATQRSREATEARDVAEIEKRKAEVKADSIKSLLDAINEQRYYASNDSIAAAKSKSLTENALNSIDAVINQTTDTASINKLKSTRNELQAGISPGKGNDQVINAITAGAVQQVMPKASLEHVIRFVNALNKVMGKYEINTTNRIAAFIAQVAHETGELHYLEESSAAAAAYQGKSYLDNTQPGDGVKYKGRGLIQLTGKANYTHFSNPPEYDLVNNPELLSNIDVATDVACRWWAQQRLNALADNDDLPAITKKINGGLNGLADRTQYYFKAKEVFSR